jgi:hypothetical protein
MSFKTSADEWVRSGPTRAIAVIAAAGLVVGAVIGAGVGFKVEQSRTKDDVKRLQRELAAATPAGQVKGSGPLGQRVGKVTAATAGSITIASKKRGSQKVKTSAATTFGKAEKGATTDIVAGGRVLVTDDGREVIVLLPTSRLGRVISKVGSDFFTIARPSGATASRIKMTNLKSISTVKAATSADVKAGVDIIAGGRAATDDVFNTVEVIVLPTGSGFAG